MAFEVSDEGVVVHGEVANAIVDFGRGVEDRGGVVCESREGGTVFMRFQLFRMRAGFCVEELDRVVGAGEEDELAAVVEVDRGVGCGWRRFV